MSDFTIEFKCSFTMNENNLKEFLKDETVGEASIEDFIDTDDSEWIAYDVLSKHKNFDAFIKEVLENLQSSMDAKVNDKHYSEDIYDDARPDHVLAEKIAKAYSASLYLITNR